VCCLCSHSNRLPADAEAKLHESIVKSLPQEAVFGGLRDPSMSKASRSRAARAGRDDDDDDDEEEDGDDPDGDVNAMLDSDDADEAAEMASRAQIRSRIASGKLSADRVVRWDSGDDNDNGDHDDDADHELKRPAPAQAGRSQQKGPKAAAAAAAAAAAPKPSGPAGAGAGGVLRGVPLRAAVAAVNERAGGTGTAVIGGSAAGQRKQQQRAGKQAQPEEEDDGDDSKHASDDEDDDDEEDDDEDDDEEEEYDSDLDFVANNKPETQREYEQKKLERIKELMDHRLSRARDEEGDDDDDDDDDDGVMDGDDQPAILSGRARLEAARKDPIAARLLAPSSAAGHSRSAQLASAIPAPAPAQAKPAVKQQQSPNQAVKQKQKQKDKPVQSKPKAAAAGYDYSKHMRPIIAERLFVAKDTPLNRALADRAKPVKAAQQGDGDDDDKDDDDDHDHDDADDVASAALQGEQPTVPVGDVHVVEERVVDPKRDRDLRAPKDLTLALDSDVSVCSQEYG